jgi:hypothetical protein
MKVVYVLLLAGVLASCKNAPTASSPLPTSPASRNKPPTSDEESIARVEQERARIRPGEQLVLVYQDIYPQWNTYTVTLTPQNEQEVLKNVSADSIKLAGRKPTHQAVIVFRSQTDEPAVWSYIKKRVADAAAN